MIRCTSIAALISCLSTAAAAQSLGEVAEKERTRREAIQAQVKTIDDSKLREYRGRTTVPEQPGGSVPGPAETEESATSAAPPREPRPGGSVAAKPDRHEPVNGPECTGRLKRAREELKQQQAAWRAGVVIWAESQRPVVFVDPSVVGPCCPFHNDGSYVKTVRYQQGRVSCIMAIRNRSRYPDEAARCEVIQSTIEHLRAAIGKGCN